MNRREFLHMLGIGAVTVAAPKIIFDMGKNSAIYTPKLIPYSLYYLDEYNRPKLLDTQSINRLSFSTKLAVAISDDTLMFKSNGCSTIYDPFTVAKINL